MINGPTDANLKTEGEQKHSWGFCCGICQVHSSINLHSFERI